MLADTLEITFRPVETGDLELLGDWMTAPHWRKWWGNPTEELGFIREMVDGNDTTRPFIFEVDGRSTGYIQYWLVGEHQTEKWAKDYPWLMELPADAIGVDLSIGPAECLSAGIGSSALAKFVRMLIGNGYRTIIIDPDPGNTRAVRAYQKAGFRPIERLEGKYSDVLLMQYDLNENE